MTNKLIDLQSQLFPLDKATITVGMSKKCVWWTDQYRMSMRITTAQLFWKTKSKIFRYGSTGDSFLKRQVTMRRNMNLLMRC
jgi:hypothetical protein